MTTRQFLLFTLTLLSGCAATIEPPVTDPNMRPVFLLDHGRTSSLVLVSDNGSMTRYTYGEWLWYAKQQTGVRRAFAALFIPTTATLGRKDLNSPPTAANLRRQLAVEVAELHCLAAQPQNVETLRHKLDALFAQQRNSLIYNKNYDLEFVVHPQPYTLWHNSNHVVAAWLNELGFNVAGSPMLGAWRVVTSEDATRNRLAAGAFWQCYPGE